MNSPVEFLQRQEEALAAKEEAERQEQLRIAAAYSGFFSHPSGIAVLEVMGQYLNGNTFKRDPYESAYEAGRRSVYLDILAAVGNAHATMEAVNVDKINANMQARAELPGSIEEL